MRGPWKNFDFCHLDVSKSLTLQKKVYWWGVSGQKACRARTLIRNLLSMIFSFYFSFYFCYPCPYRAVHSGWELELILHTVEHFIKILTEWGALSWQHCQASMQCSDQCCQHSDCCAHMVTACPGCPVPQGQGCKGYPSTRGKPCWLPAPPWNWTARNKGILLPLKIPICTSRHFK